MATVFNTLTEVAKEIKDAKESLFLIYAFNATGKTRLSVEYKNISNSNGEKGLYYNAFSEDLFSWDNDNLLLMLKPSILNIYHSDISEDMLIAKLTPYKPQYHFKFNYYDNIEDGISSIAFYLGDDEDTNIKISRAEERIFIWCFFLMLFDLDIFDDTIKYIFIDDPISSVDENNMFFTIFSLYALIKKQFEKKKIIITTHHLGLTSIMQTWLKGAEMKCKFNKVDKAGHIIEPKYKIWLLSHKQNQYQVGTPTNMLYHLHILKVLDEAVKKDSIEMFHMAMLRQVLENVSSFLGASNFSHILQKFGGDFLDKVGYKDTGQIANIVNALTHKSIYYPQMSVLTENDKQLIKEIISQLITKFGFKLT